MKNPHNIKQFIRACETLFGEGMRDSLFDRLELEFGSWSAEVDEGRLDPPAEQREAGKIVESFFDALWSTPRKSN